MQEFLQWPSRFPQGAWYGLKPFERSTIVGYRSVLRCRINQGTTLRMREQVNPVA